MTNEYIEVVKRWRAGEAISLEELRANARAAYAAYATERADAAYTANDAVYVTCAATAAQAAANAAAANDAADYWVKRYEELTNGK